MSTDALFDVAPTPPVEKLSGDRRRTQRQAELLGLGQHPLAAALGLSLPLHPGAGPVDNRAAPGRRCGTCWHRRPLRTRNRTYPKCWFSSDHAGEFAEDFERVSHGAGTDVRGWWPACRDHSYGEPALSPDAARWIPNGDHPIEASPRGRDTAHSGARS